MTLLAQAGLLTQTSLLKQGGLKSRTGLLKPGSSPPPYTTGAVGFDGATSIDNDGIVSTDTQFFGRSIWYFQPDEVASGGQGTLWASDPENNYSNAVGFSNVTTDGGGIWADAQNIGGDGVITEWFPSSAGPAITPGAVGQWHHSLVAADLSGAAPHNVRFYLDGVDITPVDQTEGVGYYVNAGPAATVTFNGLSFYVGGDSFDGDQFTGYMAEFFITTASLFTGGIVSPSTIALFRNPVTGKPVDPAAAVAAYAPFVHFQQPAGSSDPTQFAINRGTGGDFDITGALTIAPSSPTD